MSDINASVTGAAAGGGRKARKARKAAKLGEPVGRSVNTMLGGKFGRTAVYLICFLWTIPTFGVLASSFRPEKDVKTSGWWKVFTDPSFTLDNYQYVLGSKSGGDDLWHFLMNSLKIAIPATILSVAIAAIAAYAFSWMEFKGREWLFVMVTSLLVVPLQMALVPLSKLINTGAHLTIPFTDTTITLIPDSQFLSSIPLIGEELFPKGLTDTYIGVWIAHTCFGLPFCIFLLKNFISSLPREVIESARVDGAGHLTIFRKLIVPLSVPAIASLCIFQFVYIFNDYLVARVFAGSAKAPIIAKLVEVSGSRGASWHLLTAAAFISMVVPLAVFFSLQRYFVRGLLAGAVKG